MITFLTQTKGLSLEQVNELYAICRFPPKSNAARKQLAQVTVEVTQDGEKITVVDDSNHPKNYSYIENAVA